jgi:hypothetical protein
MAENNTEELINPMTKKIAIQFAIYCVFKMWTLTGFVYGKDTNELWEDFIKERKDGK